MGLRTETLKVSGYEKVMVAEDSDSGLNAIVAVHQTGLGPACGGIRMLPYALREEALQDVLRLAKGMSYKSALAGLGFGGGKSVIILDPSRKSSALFSSFGEVLEELHGTYIAAKDMNISSDDLREIKTVSSHVLGIEGEPGSSGDPSPVTARGVLRALEATVEHVSGSRSLKGLRVAIQGVGHVGFGYAKLIRDLGAELWVTDIDPAAVKKAQVELQARPVAADAIYDVECDIFSPCARGAVLSHETIPRLKCRAVVGAANNQLATEEDGERLHRQGIVYAPDFAVNSGGIINIFVEYEHGRYVEPEALKKADAIYYTIREILRRSREEKMAPHRIAEKLAEERLNARH